MIDPCSVNAHGSTGEKLEQCEVVTSRDHLLPLRRRQLVATF
jgi:hypothetical protein